MIVYWSGDNWQPDGTFTVATPLTLVDMRVLSDWMFNGGRFFASGQDLASAWDALDSNGGGYFLYASNLGASYLQDSIFDLPPAPSVVGQPGTAFGGLALDLSDGGDGAGNQGWVDEIAIAPFGDLGAPETVSPAFAALDGYPVADGYTGASRAAYPLLEEPVPPFDYRSLYLSFGFEGINNDTGFSTREDVMANAMAWLLDSNEVTIHEGIVDVDSIGTSYRWDFGDGSPYSPANASNIAGHAYDAAGVYTVRVEATNAMGSRALGEMSLEVTADMVGMMQNFTAEMVSTYVAPDPLPAPVTVELPLMADTWIDGGVTGANYNDYAATVVRTTGLDNALLTFERSALPEGVEILSAELAMNLTLQSGSFGKELAVLNVEAFDTTTVTYDDAPAVYNPGASVAVPDDLGMVTFDVAGNVAAWDANAMPARVRVAHASPDAPAVDVLVNDAVALSNITFKEITDYAELPAGTYNVKVVPTGATEPVVIEANLDLAAGTDYTVAAVNELAAIEPLVLVDNNSAPAEGNAHVRFVHASPDAPAVDIAVTDGPVLFPDVAFTEATDYLPVPAGTYDLEVRLAGTDTVVLPLPGITLDEGTVYTAWAMGLAAGSGEQALTAVLSVDATADSRLGQLAVSGTGTWGRIVWDSLETYEAEPPVLVVTYRPAE